MSDFEIGNLLFKFEPGEICSSTASRRLEPKAASVLMALCNAAGVMVTRRELLDQCWGEGEGSDEALTQAVAQIRRAIEELGDAPTNIETFAKRGYRLKKAPEKTDRPLEPAKPASTTRHKGNKRIVVGIILLGLIIGWLTLPHGPRHFIKHSLGLGPKASSNQT